MTSRVLSLLAAVLAHIALIVLITSGRVHDEPLADESSLVLMFISLDAIVTHAAPPVPSPESSLRARQTPGRRSSSLPLRRESTSAAADPPVDWSRESELAALRQVDGIEAARERDRDFRTEPGAPPPDFRWDRSRTHRIEPIPTGGTIIHLNDRCFLVISGLIMPMCTIGKIEAHGDLFEHMDDTPQLGDAK
jgi:hypothetical protein